MTTPTPTTPTPTSSSTNSLLKRFKKIGAGILAAFTSPEAVKQEKSLAALVVTRLVTQAGGGAAFVILIDKLLS